MIQISLVFCNSQQEMNETLRFFQVNYPKREIKSVTVCPNEPIGYFMTITYELKGA